MSEAVYMVSIRWLPTKEWICHDRFNTLVAVKDKTYTCPVGNFFTNKCQKPGPGIQCFPFNDSKHKQQDFAILVLCSCNQEGTMTLAIQECTINLYYRLVVIKRITTLFECPKSTKKLTDVNINPITNDDMICLDLVIGSGCI